MSEQHPTAEKYLAKLRSIPLETRIVAAQQMIGKMCSQSRPPKMTIPVQWDDEDFYITNTLGDARERIRMLDAQREFLHARRQEAEKASASLKADSARLRWILDHPETFRQMSERFAGEALLALIDSELQEICEKESKS